MTCAIVLNALRAFVWFALALFISYLGRCGVCLSFLLDEQAPEDVLQLRCPGNGLCSYNSFVFAAFLCVLQCLVLSALAVLLWFWWASRHAFHASCAETWFWKTSKHVCPYCRSAATEGITSDANCDFYVHQVRLFRPGSHCKWWRFWYGLRARGWATRILIKTFKSCFPSWTAALKCTLTQSLILKGREKQNPQASNGKQFYSKWQKT